MIDIRGWSTVAIPGAILAIAASTLLLRSEPESCEPQDPIRATVGETVFAIPAVLLPSLSPEEGVEVKQESEALTGKKAFSAKGTPLRWWFCADPMGVPFRVDSFFIEKRWIADAVKHGEIDYRYLPSIGGITVRKGQVSTKTTKDLSGPPYFTDTFRAECGRPLPLSGAGAGQRTTRACSASHVNASADTIVELRFWLHETAGSPVVNAPEDWPAIAREVEHLVKSMIQQTR